MAKIVDGVRKLNFLVQQAHAATTLADAIPDPAGKRFAASGVFVALDAFLALARQTRNAIPASKQNRSDLAKAKAALNELADRDWGPYVRFATASAPTANRSTTTALLLGQLRTSCGQRSMRR